MHVTKLQNLADRSSGAAYLAYLVISGGARSNKKIGSQTKGDRERERV